ncbi:MAG: sugar transporter, partial [Helicobacteraceae bacterium]|nr:sugar transporter [Helicobacteraceae bacterium]
MKNGEKEMETKKRLVEGDIFYVQYNGKYFFGKILMDVSERMPVRNIPMKFFHDCYLVGVYKGIYDDPILTDKEFIIPSIYTQKKQFYLKNDKTDWTFYENESVNFKRDINFP